MNASGHYTSHTEAINRKTLISNITYDITLALNKETSSFFAQATITFDIDRKLRKEDYKYVFLNFSNGDLNWICEDIVINNAFMAESSEMYYSNRINFEKVLDSIFEMMSEDEKTISF